jgi:hypothetical protein
MKHNFLIGVKSPVREQTCHPLLWSLGSFSLCIVLLYTDRISWTQDSGHWLFPYTISVILTNSAEPWGNLQFFPNEEMLYDIRGLDFSESSRYRFSWFHMRNRQVGRVSLPTLLISCYCVFPFVLTRLRFIQLEYRRQLDVKHIGSPLRMNHCSLQQIRVCCAIGRLAEASCAILNFSSSHPRRCSEVVLWG